MVLNNRTCTIVNIIFNYYTIVIFDRTECNNIKQQIKMLGHIVVVYKTLYLFVFIYSQTLLITIVIDKIVLG